MSTFKGLLSALVLSNVSKARDSLSAPVRYGRSHGCVTGYAGQRRPRVDDRAQDV